MPASSPAEAATDALLDVDSSVREAFVAHRHKPAVTALSWLSDVGDQPQMRLLAGALFALGAVRRDSRMTSAGVRMLLAHEVATMMKNFVKGRVDRHRPRSASTEEEQKPRLGRHRDKELSSFPSGHSAGALAVARAFSAEYPEHKVAALSGAGAVALAQIPRCAHYPTDVGAGLVVGAVAEAAVGLVWRAAATALRR